MNVKASTDNRLGVRKPLHEEYGETTAYCEKSTEIEEKQPFRNDFSLALSYNNISSIYASIGHYAIVLLLHRKALPIYKQSVTLTQPEWTTSCNKIGLVYSETADYAKALSFYEKAVAIYQPLFTLTKGEQTDFVAL